MSRRELLLGSVGRCIPDQAARFAGFTRYHLGNEPFVTSRWTTFAAIALAALLSLALVACGGEDDDVGGAAESIATEVEDAGGDVGDALSGAIDDARRELEDAEIGDDVSGALDEAETALEEAGEGAGEEGDDALEQARDSLVEARDGLDDELEDADDETREAAEKARDALDRAIEQIDEELEE